MEYLYVYGAVLVVSIVGMIGAALLFGSHMEEPAAQPMNDPIFRREWFDIAREPGVYDPDEVGIPLNDGHDPDLQAERRYAINQMMAQGLITREEWLNQYEQYLAPIVPQPVQGVIPGPAAIADEIRQYYQMQAGRLMPNLLWAPPGPEEVARLQQEREQAQERAETLLLEKLTDEQLIAWRYHRYVEVKGSRTGHTYRIHGVNNAYSMNVDCKEDWMTYCAYPGNASETPIQDVILAQMLWITCDEDGFLQQANKSRGFCSRNTDWTRPARPENATLDLGFRPLLVGDNTGAYRVDNAPDFGFQVAPFLYPMPAGITWEIEVGRHRPTIRNRGRDGGQHLRVRTTGVDRTGHEAWVPDRCIELGCEIRVEPDRYGGGRIIDHNGQMAMRLEDSARNYSSREIRRTLERRLHTEGR